MKWLINGFCMLLLILMFMADGWAVGVLNTNMSVDYLRTSNRNASTDVDAAFFNPAGLALLPNGLYFNVGNQAIHEKRSITDSSTAIRTYVGRGSDEEYSSSETAWLFPTLNIAYRQDAITVFGSAGPIGGGAKIHYTSGVPVLDAFGIGLGTGVATAYGDTMTGYTRDAEFSGSSVYYGASAGIAYKINEMLSAAIGARYIYVKNHIEGHLRNIVITTAGSGTIALNSLGANNFEVDLDQTGQCWGAIAGLNFALGDLNIGLQYQYFGKLVLENDTSRLTIPSSDDGTIATAARTSFGDGVKTRATLPSLLAAGASYRLLPSLRVEADCNYYFVRQTDLSGEEHNFQNGVEIGAAVEYTLMPELRLSAGILREREKYKAASRDDLDFELNSYQFSVGAVYSIMPGLDLSVGFMQIIYSDAKGTSPVTGSAYGSQEYSDNMRLFGIGVTWKAM